MIQDQNLEKDQENKPADVFKVYLGHSSYPTTCPSPASRGGIGEGY